MFSITVFIMFYIYIKYDIYISYRLALKEIRTYLQMLKIILLHVLR